MDKALFISMSGAKETRLSQRAHMNNLANVNTDGFRADMAQQRAMSVFGDGFPSRAYAMSERPATDFAPGPLITTGRDLDVAVNGVGWIAVQAPDGGEAYTRTASLEVNPLGQLLTADGRQVLGNNGPIALPPFQKMDIDKDGTISIIPQGQTPELVVVADRIKLVSPDETQLRKGLDGLVRRGDGGVEPANAAITLTPGVLEASNVNPVVEMVSVIDAARQYDMNVRMMREMSEVETAASRLLQVG